MYNVCMKRLILTLFRKIKYWLNQGSFKSSETHWVNHICDETVSWPNAALMWANVHGFDEGPGAVYWLGVDIRSFGIRCADYVLKFRSKSLYDEYKDAAIRDTENILYKMRDDPRMKYADGDDMDVEYSFRWGDEEKTFHLHVFGDSYAEEDD